MPPPCHDGWDAHHIARIIMLPPDLSEDAMRAAWIRRDKAADGRFVIAVRTTGIFCRSSCPARPKAENIRFMADARAATAAGFRPCKRCKPLQIG